MAQLKQDEWPEPGERTTTEQETPATGRPRVEVPAVGKVQRTSTDEQVRLTPDTTTEDPRGGAPKPEFKHQQPIDTPGLEDELTPEADHGETSYVGTGRLAGRVALLTGGDSGIGRAVAIAFAREGADVAISYLPEEEQDAAQTCDWVARAGRRALPMPGDICDERHCRELVDRVFETFGRLDLLINNAAYQMTYDSIDDMTVEEIDRTFRTNVFATLWLCRAALPRMEPGGVIINTSSIQAYNPSPTLVPYAATKAALVNLTKSLSKLAMKQGVRVNAVAPGPVWTPLIPSTMPEESVRKFGKDTSYERPAQPAELAPIYVFLGSNESRYVTGEVFAATGGKTPY